MKRLPGILSGLSIMVLVLLSCEGPMGPDGKDGIDGQDANETCKKCHNNETDISGKFAQINLSMHVSGEAWFEGTRNSCAPCHSKKGFLDVIKTNAPNNKYLASASVLSNPEPIGCGTCHKIHTAYDSTDFAFTFDGPINLLIDTTKNVTVDLNNSSQLCMKCHQPRLVKQMDYAGAPTTKYTGITSYRFGPHYGTVGAIFAGKGAFEISGSAAYQNSQHTTLAECATCHMAAQNGPSGGHTFFARNEESNSINTNGCKTCHTNSTTLATLIANTQNDIKTLLNQLGTKIDEIGGATGGILEKDGNGDYTGYMDIYDASSNPDAKWKGSSSVSVALPVLPDINNTQAAAIVNFMLVLREKSYGIHNYTYTKALLSNSLAAL